MQTADKIQVALLCVQIIVAVVQVITTLYFIRSVGITKRQEIDAKNQILLAQQQLDLMAQQMELTASQYSESLRPLIAVSLKQTASNLCAIELRNEGLGPALNVRCDPKIVLQAIVIGSKSAVIAHVPLPEAGSLHTRLFTLWYESLDGKDYSTSFGQKQEQFFVVDYRNVEGNGDLEILQALKDGYAAGA